jgi:hypothetical protein
LSYRKSPYLRREKVFPYARELKIDTDTDSDPEGEEEEVEEE